ncbi:MAG: DUF2723 domain-containing protein, partial [Rhodothermales bacterium]|nr:DUF2723 domain-containing protein [Rhodothermales bacterium]
DGEKYFALLHVETVDGRPVAALKQRIAFEDLTPLLPSERLQLEHPGCGLDVRLVDLLAPMGRGQRTLILSPPHSGRTVLLTHLVIVRLVRTWKGAPEAWGGADRLAALAGGAVGACAFAVTDSFWFNAVESEVYALSMFFTAIVVWLILRWREEKIEEEAALRARGEHLFGLKSDRYLVLIAYLFGLAIGVHLLNVLTLFFIALVVYFVDYEREEWAKGKRWLGIAAAGVVAAAIFLVIYPGVIQWLPSWAEASGAPVLFFLAVVALVVGAVWWTQKERRPVANLAAISVLMLLIGYSTYALIFIRSAADPPIDENDPETVEAIVSYLKREQYGQTPLLTGPTYDNVRGTFTREDAFLPRRWSPMPQHVGVYRRYDSDWDFFWDYQIGHMYTRYFLWNFVGRAADTQDAPWASGFTRTASDAAFEAPSERASRNVYYGLPLLLGLIGLAFHFARDWRRAFAVLVLFLVTGIGIILYLNQTPLQPRERDYSYVASFFAFSLWIGIGATGLVELTADALKEKARNLRLGAGGAVAALCFLLVPGLMLQQNYDDHDRSGRYVAPDFAYNMLQSLAPNAILFTNGDNDTFPLWYLQEVEGVRRDVRVVNLSLLQTPWYIKQLKNQWSRESAPIPMTFPDDRAIDELAPMAWEPREVSLPVGALNAETREQLGDPVRLPDQMTWTVQGRPYSDEFNVLYVNDQAVLNIVAAVASQGWERPVYFATTAAADGQVGLDPFLQQEGLALRVTPIRSEGRGPRIVPEVALERLSKFRFTNLDDPGVYFDENIRTMVDNYRSAVFAPTAEALAQMGYRDEAAALLGRLDAEVPFETVPPDFVSLYLLAEAYLALGDDAQVAALMGRAEPVALAALEGASTQQEINFAVQYVQTVQALYLETGAYQAAADFSGAIAEAIGDESYRQTAEQLRRLYEESAPPAPEEPAVVEEQG